MAAETRRSFLEIFFALATPHGFRSNSKENKNPFVITILGLKDYGGFKGRQEVSQYQVVTVRDFCKLWL